MAAKHEKEALVREHNVLEKRLVEVEGSTRSIENDLVEKDNLIVDLQAQYRSKADQVTKAQIELADLESLYTSYGKKNAIGKKQLHSENCKNRELQAEIKAIEDKINNLKTEKRDTTWQYEKVELSNKEVI